VATPHPKKSVSSVQMGQPSANAAARIGQSSGSRWPSRSRASTSNSPQTSLPIVSTRRPQVYKKASACPGSLPRLITSAGRCSSASAKATSGEETTRLRHMLRSLHGRASRGRPVPKYWRQRPAPFLAFRFFSRAARRIPLYSSIRSSSLAPHEAII
jgi:hypothetical protein